MLHVAKERGGFGGFDDDMKFDSPWRRDGPLPDLPNSRDASRRRFDGPSSERPLLSVAENVDQWRSNRPSRLAATPDPEPTMARRKSSGFSTPEGQTGPADTDEKWTKGSKFTPSTGDDIAGSKFGGFKGRSDMGPPKELPAPSIADENDWRNSSRPKPTPRGSTPRAYNA
jgi:translation initiation factor 4B